MIQEFSIILTALFFSVSPTIRIVLVFLFSYAEGLPIIGSILPGGTIALLVGSMSTSGFINPLLAISIIAFGSFLGDITGFILGKKFKHLKWLKNLAEHEKHQKKWDIFDRHIAIIVIFGKLIPVIRSTPSFFAGIRNIKTQKYLLLSFIGSILWAITGVLGGAFITKFLGPSAVGIIIAVLIISGIVVFSINRYNKIKKIHRDKQ